VAVGASIEQNTLQKRNTHASDENRNPALKSVADYKSSQFMLKNAIELKLSVFFSTNCGIFRYMLKMNVGRVAQSV
jgi:hypothetical protein